MEINRKLIFEKKWTFILIYFILLFNPVFYFWADNISLKDKVMAWITCLIVGLALCCINLFLKKKGEKIYSGILFLMSLAPNIIVWTYLHLSSLYMRRDMFWVIFTTHTAESKEYFSQFISWQIVVICIIYLLIGIFLIIKSGSNHALSIKKHRFLFSLSVCIVLACISLQYLSQTIPSIEFYKSKILFWAENQKFQKEIELRKDLKMEVECLLPDSTNHVFVILLGESTSSCHMSLYGYFRETTPLMDAVKDDLFVYTDVITPDNHTFAAMQKILTFANHENPEYYRQKPSVMEMFKTAGFHTYWVSNHALLTKWGGSYGVIAAEAEHLYDLNPLKATDEVVLPALDEILHDSIQGNKIIFIHLMGNHHAYNCRYPKEYNYFNYKERGDLTADFRTASMKKTIDEYDNSIRFGDFIFADVMEQLKAYQSSSYLLFFSDHGEEVHDTREAAGHFMTNVYPCQTQIPFVFWCSDAYKESMPEIVFDTTRPYSIENVIHSLSTLSGFRYKDYQPDKSIFSTEYKVPEKRMVGNEDYDREIIHKK